MKRIFNAVAAASLFATLALAQPHYQITDLGTLGGAGTNSTATEINNFGLVVGSSNLVANGPQHALRTMMWLLIGQGLATFMLSVALWLGSGLITRLFLGAGFEAAKPALQWLSAVPALVGINNDRVIAFTFALG